ncbi:TonB-dependent receptor domain-containing protein [Colwellia sp. Bg11-12]|jgi:vitamin B12 transporter|uniref:TonB-dependent receptor domain-containing protein n=1 Tax=Colwellia sp. Bg11-12 TaxID=2759817 RepID=UPI0015F49408|nr:TonB-dependent receptor [Colwellia sp. Bg11-12]MBA6262987.1 TonB-dependent receptor [Colwellia sp. Bg11-12]
MKTKLFNKTPIQLAIAGIIFSSLTSSIAYAKDANADEIENIIITANRTQQEQFLTLSATQVITKEDIVAFQPQNVTDLLEKVAGISVVNQGGAGQASSVSMRGTSSGHTLVLVDGVRIGSATLGSTSFGGISVALIERIEVVKGPRAALWGSDAIGGVIQIFTKKQQLGEGVISAGLGSNGLWKTDASIGLGNEQHSLTLSASAEESDGFSATKIDGDAYDTDEDGYSRFSLAAIGESKINDEFSLHLASRWEQGGAEYDQSIQYYNPDNGSANESEYENYYLRVAGQYQSGALFTELSLSTSQDQGETFGNDVKKSDSDEIKTQRDQFSALGQYSFSDATSITAGVDFYTEEVSTDTDKDAWTPGFQKWAVEERDVNAVFIQARHQLDAFLFEGAVRRDDIEDVDVEVTYNASVGYQINDSWLVSLNRSTGFKAPSFNDLYWPGSGNPDVKPESITSNEILIRNQFSSDGIDGSVEMSFFESDIENLIAWSPNASGAWQPSNINQADIQGLELTLNATAGDFSHQLAIASIDAKDAQLDVQLARRPEVTANYTLGYHWQEFTLNGVLSYRDESPEKTNADSDILDDYWLVNVSLSYQATNKLVFIGKVNNLFDEEYETAQNYVADGTNFLLTATYSF